MFYVTIVSLLCLATVLAKFEERNLKIETLVSKFCIYRPFVNWRLYKDINSVNTYIIQNILLDIYITAVLSIFMCHGFLNAFSVLARFMRFIC